MAAAFLLLLLLAASGGAVGSDDGAGLPHVDLRDNDGASQPHLQLRGIPDSDREHASDAPPRGALMDIMSKNGCGSFASLLTATPNATETFEQHIGAGGLTVFCPNDLAVAAFEPKFGNMSADAQLAVLLHHGAAARYGREQISTFDRVAVRTLATDPGTNKSLALAVSDDGDTMRLSPSPPSSGGIYGTEARVTKAIWSDESPLMVYVVDAVLLPSYLRHGGYLRRWLHYIFPIWKVVTFLFVAYFLAGLFIKLIVKAVLR